MRMAMTRWQFFLSWLEDGVSSIRPSILWRTLGPVSMLLPVARKTAEAMTPWLISLLAEYQRRGLGEAALADAGRLAEDRAIQPLRRQEGHAPTRWLLWLLEGELARLARLVTAPEREMTRDEWPTWEVRYWALAATLERVGMGFRVLARRFGDDEAQRLLEAAAERVWQQVMGAAQAA